MGKSSVVRIRQEHAGEDGETALAQAATMDVEAFGEPYLRYVNRVYRLNPNELFYLKVNGITYRHAGGTVPENWGCDSQWWSGR